MIIKEEFRGDKKPLQCTVVSQYKSKEEQAILRAAARHTTLKCRKNTGPMWQHPNFEKFHGTNINEKQMKYLDFRLPLDLYNQLEQQVNTQQYRVLDLSQAQDKYDLLSLVGNPRNGVQFRAKASSLSDPWYDFPCTELSREQELGNYFRIPTGGVAGNPPMIKHPDFAKIENDEWFNPLLYPPSDVGTGLGYRLVSVKEKEEIVKGTAPSSFISSLQVKQDGEWVNRNKDGTPLHGKNKNSTYRTQYRYLPVEKSIVDISPYPTVLIRSTTTNHSFTSLVTSVDLTHSGKISRITYGTSGRLLALDLTGGAGSQFEYFTGKLTWRPLTEFKKVSW